MRTQMKNKTNKKMTVIRKARVKSRKNIKMKMRKRNRRKENRKREARKDKKNKMKKTLEIIMMGRRKRRNMGEGSNID